MILQFSESFDIFLSQRFIISTWPMCAKASINTIEFLPIHARYSPTLLFPILSERETNHQDCCGNSPDYIERVTTVPVVSHEEMTLENASQPNTPLLPKLHSWVYMSSTYCLPCKTPRLRSLSITKHFLPAFLAK